MYLASVKHFKSRVATSKQYLMQHVLRKNGGYKKMPQTI
jgi:hypothetical protein